MTVAPSDRDADAVYARLVREAEAAGLLLYTFSGVATLAIPSAQREYGSRAAVLRQLGLTEHPHNPQSPPGVPAETSEAPRNGAAGRDGSKPPRAHGDDRNPDASEATLFDGVNP
jgi:hypothetical protein